MKKVILLSIPIFIIISMWGCGIINMHNPEADEFDVQIVGDSAFDLNGHIHTRLMELSGKSYKDNASSGDTLRFIKRQYRRAIDDNPYIRTIIMDGGANDIITHMFWNMGCRSDGNPSYGCKRFLRGLSDDIEELWEEMEADGVEDIIHMGYYHLKGGYIVGNGKRLNGAVDYAVDITKTKCLLSPVNCHFAEMRKDFLGNEASYIKSDGLHPTIAGSTVLADNIWEAMVAADVYR